MPKDYSKLLQQQTARRNLNTTSAVINSIRSGNIKKAELISGVELLPKNPVLQALINRDKTIKAEEKSKDIGRQLALVNSTREALENQTSKITRALKMASLSHKEKLQEIANILQSQTRAIPLPPIEDTQEELPVITFEEIETTTPDIPEGEDDNYNIKNINTNLEIGNNTYLMTTIYDR